MSNKVDFRKTLRNIYNPPKGPFHLIEVPAMNFIMKDGIGNPNTSPDYQQAVEALYSLSYGIKFSTKSLGTDYVVPPLEGLWWMENMAEFTLANKDRWMWTMMIMQPEWINAETVEEVRQSTYKKKRNPTLLKLRFEPLQEGLSVQILYTGAYENEAPIIAQMHQYINSNNFQVNGRHHEIYLGDPRKTPPEKLQTILRQPVKKFDTTR